MAKSLEQAVEREDSLAIDLARRDLEREASECYKGYIAISRLKRIPNEAVKCNMFACEEEVRRFPSQYTELVKSPDGHMLGLNCEMYKAFQAHFSNCFAHCPDLPVQEFCSYLADFPRLWEAEVASCEAVITECEVHDALKQVRLNKLSGLDDLLYEVYLRLPHYSDGYVQLLVCLGSHPW